MSTLDELTRLIAEHEAAFAAALAAADAGPAGSRDSTLEALKVGWTGRKSGKIADLMAQLPSLPPADRRDPATPDRRAPFRGGRRIWDRQLLSVFS